MPFLQTDTSRLYYEIRGRRSDPTVVLIGGLGDQCVEWELVGFAGRLIEDGFRVISFDNRDAGLSTHYEELNEHGGSSTGTRYNLDDMAADVRALVGEICVEPAHVFATSIGGTIALIAALADPSLFSSIVVAFTSVDVEARLGPLPPAGVLALEEAYTRHHVDAHTLEAAIWGRWVRSGSVHTMSQPLARTIANAMIDRNYSPEGALRQFNAFGATPSFRAKLADVTVPVTVVSGTDDLLFGPKHGVDLVEALSDADHVIYEGAGHCLVPSLLPDITHTITSFYLEHG